MEVQLLRIDSRLLHGQVTTSWARALNIDYIIIASDSVAQDRIRQALMLQAAPSHLKVSVTTIDSLIYNQNHPQLKGVKVMIIVETPRDARRLVENGITIDEVNIGSLSFQTGSVMVTNTIAVTDNDVREFQWLHQHHIQLYMQKVATDIRKDFWPILVEKKHLKK